jgi:hypothetical protein
MKRFFPIIITGLILSASPVIGQTASKTISVGKTFFITLPDYMSRTVGLNSAASLQYKSEVKDVYGFVIGDDKEELKLAELDFSSVTEFYEDFMESFLVDAEKKNVSTPVLQKKGEISFLECDVSYYDKEAGAEIYYLVGIVETSFGFYKILSWTTLENKAKFKNDFRSILYSFRY